MNLLTIIRWETANIPSSAKNTALVTKIRELRSELTKVQNRAAHTANSASRASEDANFHISNLSSQVRHCQERNDAMRKMLRALKAQCTRAPRIQAWRVYSRGTSTCTDYSSQRVFSSEGWRGDSKHREVARYHYKNTYEPSDCWKSYSRGWGCCENPTWRNLGLTISADSTSHRKINYEARHVALRTPDYRSSDLTVDLNSTPSVHLLGVDSEVDHTSEVSVAGWLDKMEDVAVTFNKSPLSQRMECEFTMSDLADINEGVED